MNALGPLLRQLRKASGQTQQQLASRFGMSRATISAFENGTVTDLGIRKVEALFESFGYSLTAVPKRRRPTLGEVVGDGFHQRSGAE